MHGFFISFMRCGFRSNQYLTYLCLLHNLLKACNWLRNDASSYWYHSCKLRSRILEIKFRWESTVDSLSSYLIFKFVIILSNGREKTHRLPSSSSPPISLCPFLNLWRSITPTCVINEKCFSFRPERFAQMDRKPSESQVLQIGTLKIKIMRRCPGSIPAPYCIGKLY